MRIRISTKTAWIFALAMMVPVAMISAEEPSSKPDRANQKPRPAAAAGGDAAPLREFRLIQPTFRRSVQAGSLDLQPPSTLANTKADTEYFGIVATAATAGGKFMCDGGTGVAYLGYGSTGVQGEGSTGVRGEGAYYGVRGYGTTMGGYFTDSGASGYANLGYGDWGIYAAGDLGGGYFEDSNSSSYGYVGHGDYGVSGYGVDGVTGYGTSTGGVFEGITMGGYFETSAGSSTARVAYGSYGIDARGSFMGGYFADDDGSGSALLGYGDYGVEGHGSVGVSGLGTLGGGYFLDSNQSGYAWVGTQHSGIHGYGNIEGGYFNDLSSSVDAHVAYSTYKISGTGSVSFVQNHPFDPGSVIVYAAPEGDEVATYTRGTARLVSGEAQVSLGETFQWVTNPDIGLTAHVTPRGDCGGLYVASLTTEKMVVQEMNGGTSDITFDYLVYGLRIGFEESSVVQEKELEAYIPSMADHRRLYQRHPDLRGYNSFERFKGMHHAFDPKAELDLSRAHALRDAIIEFDPAVHELPGIHRRPEPEEHMPAAPAGGRDVVGIEPDHGERNPEVGAADAGTLIGGGTIPVDAGGNVYATSFRPSSQDLASLVDVSEVVKPGDVLVIDRDSPGMMRRSFGAHDTGVIGVVTAHAGVVLGMQPPVNGISRMRDSEIEGSVPGDDETASSPSHRAAVGLAGVVTCNVDADYGAVWPGDLLVTSPTPGHAMRADGPLPGTMLGKALEPLEEGTGAIRVLVMLR
jgi:hypothetical protein